MALMTENPWWREEFTILLSKEPYPEEGYTSQLYRPYGQKASQITIDSPNTVCPYYTLNSQIHSFPGLLEFVV